MRVAILGFGKSGQSAKKLLHSMNVSNIDIFDDAKRDYPAIAEIKDDYDLYVISPGIDANTLKLDPKKITNEIDIAYNYLSKRLEKPFKKIVAVTGTNGKSTIAYLTAEIFKNLKINAVACGNIGYAFGDAVLEGYEYYVVELSSFQIDLIKDFKCSVSCISNITADHLDRYKTFENYVDSKLKIKNITEDILFALDEEILVKNLKSGAKYIDPTFTKFPKLSSNTLYFDNFYVNLEKFKLLGAHNITNLAFALSIVNSFYNFTDDKTSIIENLNPLPHRCEYIDTIDSKIFINDSKGTNVDSTLTALKSFNFPVSLILGGKDKGGDFTKLIDEINKKVDLLVVYGSAADTIEKQIKGDIKCNILKTYSLKDAVNIAFLESKSGSHILFSPACASFDQFKNFEERGDCFKVYVKEIREKMYAKR